MKGIVFATAAIAIGISAGFAAPWLVRSVSIDIKPVPSRSEPVSTATAAATTDPGGLVGAAEGQPGNRRYAVSPPARQPAPARPATTAERPARAATASSSVDCRRYVPESQVTVTVPCNGKKAEVENKDDDKTEKKETRKSRKDSKSSRSQTAEDSSSSEGVGICRRYVTRAGITMLQKVPCNAKTSGGSNRVAATEK